MASSEACVLLVDDSLFEGNYIASVTAACGVTVHGPVPDAATASQLIEQGANPGAVIAAYREGDEAIAALLARLHWRGVACLVLMRDANQASPQVPQGVSILPAPFAAYQIADWAVAACRGRELSS